MQLRLCLVDLVHILDIRGKLIIETLIEGIFMFPPMEMPSFTIMLTF